MEVTTNPDTAIRASLAADGAAVRCVGSHAAQAHLAPLSDGEPEVATVADTFDPWEPGGTFALYSGITTSGRRWVVLLTVDDAKRDRQGRYTYTDFARVCRCGHTLGHHGAERIRVNGKTLQGCLHGTGLEGEDPDAEPCDCACFAPKRKRANKK